MAKNSPDPITVSAVDARAALQTTLDETIMALESRNRNLAAQRKQLDLETQSNDDAISVARDGIKQLDNLLSHARDLSLAETE